MKWVMRTWFQFIYCQVHLIRSFEKENESRLSMRIKAIPLNIHWYRIMCIRNLRPLKILKFLPPLLWDDEWCLCFDVLCLLLLCLFIRFILCCEWWVSSLLLEEVVNGVANNTNTSIKLIYDAVDIVTNLRATFLHILFKCFWVYEEFRCLNNEL